MKKWKVLFSPIGGSDPIRTDSDGPMLHIVRHENPTHVKLFFTKEMAERYPPEQHDQWIKAIAGDHIQILPKIVKKDMTDPSDFEGWTDIFQRYLKELVEFVKKELPDGTAYEILINISSGTPQMITALSIIASTSTIPNLRCVQVTTPANGANKSAPQQQVTTPDQLEYWEERDNPKAEYRIKHVKLTSHTRKLVLSNLMGLIGEGQYHAAARLAEMNRDYLTDTQQMAIQGAWKRKQLETKEAFQLLNDAGIPVPAYSSGEVAPIVEFYLGMRHDLLTGDYIRFFARLDPLLVEVGKYYLKKKHGLDFLSYENQGGRYEWDKIKLDFPCLVKVLSENTNSAGKSYLSARLLERCIEALNANADALTCYRQLFKYVKVRNMIAHRITPLDEKAMTQKTGHTPGALCDEIDGFVMTLLCSAVLQSDLENRYRNMNTAIIHLLNNGGQMP